MDRVALCFLFSTLLHQSTEGNRVSTERLINDRLQANASLEKAATSALSPIIWVPGITSSSLEAYHKKGDKLPRTWCRGMFPADKWFTLYVSATQATNPPCLLASLQLQPPPDKKGRNCVSDAEGLEIQEVAFGSVAGNDILNPGGAVSFKLYEAMIQAWEELGHKRDKTIKFASYDWRKYGDPCWEDFWWPKLKKLVEDTVKENGGEKATLGCHSMGCALTHQFLNLPFITTVWKKRYIKEFIATGPAFAGAATPMQNFVSGPVEALPLAVSQAARVPTTSFPSLYTLMPQPGLGAWPEDFVFVETPWKNYTIASIKDGSFFNEVEPGDQQQEELAQQETSEGGNAMNAGPGFEFFLGVNTKESYEQVLGAQTEEIKVRCLADFRCTGFDMYGRLKLNAHPPQQDEPSETPIKTYKGRIQGFYVKREDVQKCQKSCEGGISQVCGTDGETYPSPCHLANAQCWKKDLQQDHAGLCDRATLSDSGCDCITECEVTIKPYVLPQRRCSTKPSGSKDCGTKNSDSCMASKSIDTQSGFDYFPQTTLSYTKDFTYKEVALRLADKPFSLESLVVICGEDIACGGFTANGLLLTHKFANHPEEWGVPSDTKTGIYRKQAILAACQRDCSGEGKSAVCMEGGKTYANPDGRKTYASVCEAENAACHLNGQRKVEYVRGPCSKLGNSGLHEFAQKWAKRTSELKPPGVPTTCVYITDKQTPQSWRYDPDFTAKAKILSYSDGDGSVNIQSMEEPCKQFQEQQEEPVKLVPLKLGGASHVTMLSDKGFNKILQHILRGTFVAAEA